MSDNYDGRRPNNNSRKERERPKRRAYRDNNNHDDTARDRSRSRSPDPSSATPHLPLQPPHSKDDQEAARRARMARLRAEVEEEEAKLSQLAEASSRERQMVSAKESIVQIDASQLEGLDEDEQMKLMLGFSGDFRSTKNKKVDDNHKSLAKGAAAKHKERKYRQYMNRKNGFNRPLDKMD